MKQMIKPLEVGVVHSKNHFSDPIFLSTMDFIKAFEKVWAEFTTICQVPMHYIGSSSDILPSRVFFDRQMRIITWGL